MSRAKRMGYVWVCVVLAALAFGIWQASWLAGAFMFLVLAVQAELALLSVITAEPRPQAEEDTLP